MRKFLVLCSAFFCLSLTASAQDSAVSFDAANTAEAEPPAPAPATFIPPDRDPWQLHAGFVYAHYNVLGQKFHTFGYQAGVTRYFNDRFGVEGTVIAGFGKTGSPSTDAKSLFVGGGAHVSILDKSRYELWGHVLGGLQHFRFVQGPVLGSNSHAAFLAGGGFDYKIHQGRLYWRVQGDYMGANFGPYTSNYLIGTGLVLNF